MNDIIYQEGGRKKTMYHSNRLGVVSLFQEIRNPVEDASREMKSLWLDK